MTTNNSEIFEHSSNDWRVLAEDFLDGVKGRDRLVAWCPKCDDPGLSNRKGLSIHDDKGVICFKCGYKPNKVEFIVDITNRTKGEAFFELARRAGVDLDDAKTVRRNGRRWQNRRPTPTAPPSKNLSRPTRKKTKSFDPDAMVSYARPKPAEGLVQVTFQDNTAPFLVSSVGTDVAGYEYAESFDILADGRVRCVFEPSKLSEMMNRYSPDASIKEFDTSLVSVLLPGVISAMLVANGDIKPGDTPSTLWIRVYQFLQAYTVPASDTNIASKWLFDTKGISYETQRRHGVGLLSYKTIKDHIVEEFGAELLLHMGLLAESKYKKGEYYFVFKNYRTIFPFVFQVCSQVAPVNTPYFAQFRNINATEKHKRFMLPLNWTPPLYNVQAILDARRAGRRVFICEGQTDVLSLADVGEYAVGLVGTGAAKNFASYVSYFEDDDEIYIATDGDDAGRKAASDIATAFSSQLRAVPKVLPLAHNQDITDYIGQRRSK